jgi:HK97 gp10 family phage protein
VRARANKVTVGVYGLDAMSNDMQNALREVVDKAQAIIERELAAAADDAREHVPVDSGKLHRSIRVKMDPSGQSGRLIAGGRRAPHGHLVEFGTKRMPARPYLYPAAQRARRRVLAELQRLFVARGGRPMRRSFPARGRVDA